MVLQSAPFGDSVATFIATGAAVDAQIADHAVGVVDEPQLGENCCHGSSIPLQPSYAMIWTLYGLPKLTPAGLRKSSVIILTLALTSATTAASWLPGPISCWSQWQ